jgi:soluble lytic murein transglycosylase-like protein
MTGRAGLMGGAVLVLLSATLVSGCGNGGGGRVNSTAAPAEVTMTPQLEATTAVATASPTPVAVASPTTAPRQSPSRAATRTTTPRPTPRTTPKPPTEVKLPPPPPKPAPSNCRPKYVGTAATRAQAKQALTDAAARSYWPTSAPSLSVPVNLVKAVAWQESGWQSNIVACDGGVGLMQVMPGSASYVNQRFDKSYDINDYRDNATLGANYLAWLTKYIGDMYFDGTHYSLDPANCSASVDACLLNAVIAAYNVGPGAVATDHGLVIPNPQYVGNVRALMTECECLSF